MLDDKIKYYAETGKMLHNTPAQYKGKYPYFREVDSLALANEQLSLERTNANFFENPKKYHFPKIESKKHNRCSDTTNVVNHNIDTVYAGGKPYGVKFPKLGVVKAKIHCLPEDNWTLKSATVSQDPDDKWYVPLLFEYETNGTDDRIDPDSAIVFDYKSNGLYMDLNGEFSSWYQFYCESEERLFMEQRCLLHKEPSSQNYEKQRIKVAKMSKHIAS